MFFNRKKEVNNNIDLGALPKITSLARLANKNEARVLEYGGKIESFGGPYIYVTEIEDKQITLIFGYFSEMNELGTELRIGVYPDRVKYCANALTQDKINTEDLANAIEFYNHMVENIDKYASVRDLLAIIKSDRHFVERH